MHESPTTTVPGAGPPATVAVLGLGPMGAALAAALLRGGVATTVWNRTARRGQPLRDAGAVLAPTPAAAVEAADLVVLCLRDHATARDTAAAAGGALAGRAVVNLSSATPAEARRSAEWFGGLGAGYLSGAIMVPTSLVGQADSLILYSGDVEVFDRHVGLLRHLAGLAEYVGADHGAAALHDVAMLEVYFAAMTSFLHAAAMTTAQGVSARRFLPYAEQIASLLPQTFAGLAAEVDAGSYPGTEDRLAMELAALEHIVATSTELGLDGGLPVVLRDLAARGVRAGRGEESFASVVEVLRRRE